MHLAWGNALLRQGKVGKAIEHYREAVRVDPGFAPAYFELGSVMERLGRPDEAIAFYRRATRIDPNHPAANRLAELESAAASP